MNLGKTTSLKAGQFWLLNLLAVVAGGLLVAYVLLFEGNLDLRKEVQQRAQFVQQTGPLEKLNNEIIKALASLAAKDQDADINKLLADHGIRYEFRPTETPAQQASQPTAQ